ncbi:hypothetical protein FJV41_51515, partial [Myxococcus llanfairpwllgwyngyllgogerychwyrndrobwllllantysiliogogogochensis]
MRSISFVTLVLACGSGLAVQAQAQEPADDSLTLSGFGTVGLVDKTGAPRWGLIRSTAQKGAASDLSATIDSRLGAQIDWTHGNDWEAAVQGVLLH